MDPWKHRSDGMKCKTCMWFVEKRPSQNALVVNMGRCRRHAPTMNGYPVVFVNDWCGDHKLDENKVHEEQQSVSAESGKFVVPVEPEFIREYRPGREK